MEQKKLITDLMRERFVTKAELTEITGLGDRQVRKLIQKMKLSYPIISTSKAKGYKIATSENDLNWVLNSIHDNRSKALSIFEGQKKLKEFARQFEKSEGAQLTLNF